MLPPGIHSPPSQFTTTNGNHQIEENIIINKEKKENGRRTSRASLRHARQRIRNYCGVL